MMSNNLEQGIQCPQVVSHGEIEVSGQEVENLSDESLEEVTGGNLAREVADSVRKFDGLHGTYKYYRDMGSNHAESLKKAKEHGHLYGAKAAVYHWGWNKSSAEGVRSYLHETIPK